MPTKTATVADFSLISIWTNTSGAITAGPSTDTKSKTFSISGVPDDVTVQTAILSVALGSPYTGAAILRVNGENADTGGTRTFSITPTASGNGDYSVEFVFKANGATGLSDGQHNGAVTVRDAVLTVTYAESPPGPSPDPEPVIDWGPDRPISVFAPENTDSFNNNGLAILEPTYGRLKTVAGGACEITMRHPIDGNGKWAYLVTDAIVRVPVPEETIENAFVGVEVDLYRTNASAALRSGTSEPSTITYQEWSYEKATTTGYAVGDKVTCTGFGNYRCVAYDSSSQQIMVPPYNNPSWWTEIPSQTTGSPVLVQLSSGADLYFLENAGSGWYKMSTPMGIEGYIKSSQVTFVRHVTPDETSERTIKNQLFRIKDVSIDTEKLEVTVYAEHVSYDLAAILVRDVKISNAAPSMAINRVLGGLMMPYRGTISTNLTDSQSGTYTGAINGKNGIFAFLDPDSGIVPTFNARFTRDNWDLFILQKTNTDRGIRMKYGKNVRGLNWKRSRDSLATRIVPVAKDAKGNDLYLPEQYVDSTYIYDYPVIRMQRLAVKGQVGKDDGTETNTKWTADTLYQEMRNKANERFSVDHVDQIFVEITVDFEQLGDTEEYAWMKELEQLLLYDTVHAEDERVGLDTAMTVSELEWDFIRKKVTKVKLSSAIDHGVRNVAGYNLINNSIGSEKLTEAAITEIANLLS